LHPLNFPNNVGVLRLHVFGFSNGALVITTDIVNGDVTVRITNSDKVRVLFGELTSCD